MKMALSLVAALTVSGLLYTGNASALSGSIRDTGPGSRNIIDFREECDIDINNNTDIDVNNSNEQNAESGDATVGGNTHGGSATSGNATNENSTSTNIEVRNRGAFCEKPKEVVTPSVPSMPSVPSVPSVPAAPSVPSQVLGASTAAPTPVTPGRGAGEEQVAAPVGGVGAGGGGATLPVLATSVVGMAAGLYRLRKLNRA